MLATAPLFAQAQGNLTYRCAGADGKKYYGSAIPMQCAGRPVEVLNSGGMVVKRIDPAAEEKERAAKAAKEGRGRTEQTLEERDEERRNRALLATYTSAKDIEDARTRALADNAQQAGRFEKRIVELRARRVRYEKELETYKKEGKRPEFQSTQERDEDRRNRALLATYTSVKDIEDARGRALRDNATQAGRFEQRIKDLQSRRVRYEKELDTYKKAGKASQTVEDNIKNVDLEIAAQEELLRAKKNEVGGINAKYDEDKKRYNAATGAKK